VRNVIREANSELKFVFHDAFLTSHLIWNDLFADDDMENVVMDTHQYLAWSPALYTMKSYCSVFNVNLTGPRVKKIKYEKWVGEWSLATDVCAQWLEGFNDARSDGYQYNCQKVECPRSYLPEEYAVDFDRSAAMLGPYGEST
jgi:glucan 1,3-beta-glucosidase